MRFLRSSLFTCAMSAVILSAVACTAGGADEASGESAQAYSSPDSGTGSSRSQPPAATAPYTGTQGATSSPRPSPQLSNPPTAAQIQQIWTTMASQVTTQPSSDPTAVPYNYPAGVGTIHTDFYGVQVVLPPNTTPEAYLLLMQNNPAAAANYSTAFTSQVTWPPNNTNNGPNRPLGQVTDLNLGAPAGHAPIIYTNVVTGRPGELVYCVETVTNQVSGDHPVSGRRCWGISQTAAGPPPRYVVWTAGIDSANMYGSYNLGGAWAQEWCWMGMINGVQSYMAANGGSAASHMTYTGDITQPSNLTPGTVQSPTNPTGVPVNPPGTIYLHR